MFRTGAISFTLRAEIVLRHSIKILTARGFLEAVKRAPDSKEYTEERMPVLKYRRLTSMWMKSITLGVLLTLRLPCVKGFDIDRNDNVSFQVFLNIFFSDCST